MLLCFFNLKSRLGNANHKYGLGAQFSLTHCVLFTRETLCLSTGPEDGAAGDTSNPKLGDNLAPSTDRSCLKNHLAQGSTGLSGAH